MSRFRRWLRGTAAAALTLLGSNTLLAQQPAPLPDVNDYLNQNEISTAGFGRHHKSATVPNYTQIPCTPSPVPGMPIPGSTPNAGMPPVVTDTNSTGMGSGLSAADFGLSGGGAGAGLGTSGRLGGGGPGYIEYAAPVTMARLRFDAAYFNNRPDRAEIFYPKCGCFMTRDANGPPLPEKSVDYQELSEYLEYAFNPRFSVFVNIPQRFINPEVNANAAGIGDISFGMKYAFVYNEKRIVSFTLRAQAPSGSGRLGLGNTNWWLEPGLLWLEQCTDRWQVFGELRDQIPLASRSDFTGNVLRYGLGTSYVVYSGRCGYVAPVVECVGWTVTNGKESNETGAVDAAGNTIVNAKFGVRIGIGAPSLGQPYPTRSDLYIGYGRALTGEVWYKDLLRVEYRWFF